MKLNERLSKCPEIPVYSFIAIFFHLQEKSFKKLKKLDLFYGKLLFVSII